MKYENILPYIEKGLISEGKHPEDEDVRIFNYTQKCQFEQAWDEVTCQCRGLIMRLSTGEILARPFPKFFNYGEHVNKGWAIPATEPIVMEKLDGSLGILYVLNGKPWIATRGSFMSGQAQWATKWLRSIVGENADFGTGMTHLFEIIYPENRIVVNYDFSGLVYLTTIKNSDGVSFQTHWNPPLSMAIRRAKIIPSTSIEDLVKMDEPNSEGFVLFYPEQNVRMKIKFPEYVRLHRIITGLNEIAIWELLRDGKPIGGLIEKVPDEFFKWVKDVSTRLLDGYEEIAEEAEKIFEAVRVLPNRKDQALAIKKMTDNYSGIVFALLDKQGGKASQQIWKMVRPHGARAFKIDIDL